MAGDLIRWKPSFYAFTACSIGTNLSDGAWKMLCTKSPPCVLFARLSLDRCLAGPHHHHGISATCWSSINCQLFQDHQSLAGGSRRHDDTTLVDATIIEAPASTKKKSSNAIRRCIRPRKAISGTLA